MTVNPERLRPRKADLVGIGMEKSERTIKAALDYEYCSAETAYGRTVPVPFSIKVF